FEHFARRGDAPDEKTEGYARFFAKCRELLPRGGFLSLQTIAQGSAPLTRQHLIDGTFILREIFHESALPRLSEISDAVERLFEIVSLRNDREDYARTCREWLERLTARREDALRVVGEEDVVRYERYLAAAARLFEGSACSLLRIQLRRVG